MTNDYGNLELHTVLLSAMKDIDKICRENGLRYYLYAGSLLGAVQHQGFIPWDDDIDLAMFPEDFRKLSQIIGRDYSDRYEVHSFQTSGKWYAAVNKISVKGTRFLHEHSDDTAPFFIDICLLYSIPDSKPARFWQRKQLELIELVWNVQSGTITPSSVVMKSTIGLLAKIDNAFWNRYFLRIANKYGDRPTRDVGSLFCVLFRSPFSGRNGYDRDITPRSWYDDPTDMDFEGCDLMTIRDPATDLDIRYPNWRTPMPESDRISKHDVQKYEISPEVRARVGL